MKNKVALVTGSASGIGEAIVRRFANEGARVVVHDLPQASGEDVAAALQAAGCDAHYYSADLADPHSCEELVEKVVRRCGKLDVLVNNASVSVRSNLQSTDATLFDRVVAVNLRAPLLLIRAALPHFRRNGGGTVLNIGSVNAYCGEPNLLAYSMTKGALATLTRNLADTHGRDRIRVNQINPGWVVTPNESRRQMADGQPADWAQNVSLGFAPFGRLLTPDEIAYWAVSFCSDESGSVTGCVCDLEQYPVIGRNPVKCSG